MKIQPRDRSLLEDEDGAIAVEYIVILILVVIVAISAWVQWRDAVVNDASNEYQTFGYPP